MKNNQLIKLLGITLLSAVAISAFNQDANAESIDTTGKVKFEGPTGPTDPEGPFALIKPGTYDEWITIPKGEGKQTTKGDFRFTFVPNFDFGTVTVSSTDKYHNLKHSIPYQSFNPDEKNWYDKDDGRTVKHLPTFLQVENLRGTNVEYKVSVKASQFVNEDGKKLDNTTIQIKDFLTRNNLLDKDTPNTNAKDILAGPGLDPDKYLSLRSDADIQIMNTVKTKGKETDGSASSLIFFDDYKLTEDYDDAEIAKNESVRLFVPAADAPTVGKTYTSDVIWTLEDTM